MSFLLDSSVCIGIMRETSPKSARTLHLHRRSEIFLCSIVRYELLFGAEYCDRPQDEREKIEGFSAGFESLAFDDDAADEAANNRAYLEGIGMRIGAYDMQIAGIGRLHGLTLVTRNVREFRRVPNLRVEDWEA
jgi:tRNA(fMet)-specific endonuclease VapC